MAKINLTDFQDRKVKVVKKTDGGKAAEVLEGRVEAANNDPGREMILLKVKGKSSGVPVFGFEIDKVELVASSDDDIKQVVLKPVKIATVRKHLVSQHGWTLSKANHLDDAEALLQHTGLHEGPDAADIGHRHEA